MSGGGVNYYFGNTLTYCQLVEPHPFASGNRSSKRDSADLQLCLFLTILWSKGFLLDRRKNSFRISESPGLDNDEIHTYTGSPRC